MYACDHFNVVLSHVTLVCIRSLARDGSIEMVEIRQLWCDFHNVYLPMCLGERLLVLD